MAVSQIQNIAFLQFLQLGPRGPPASPQETRRLVERPCRLLQLHGCLTILIMYFCHPVFV